MLYSLHSAKYIDVSLALLLDAYVSFVPVYQGGGNGMQGSDDAGGSVVAGEAGAALTLSN